jgi:hypothetical protein
MGEPVRGVEPREREAVVATAEDVPPRKRGRARAPHSPTILVNDPKQQLALLDESVHDKRRSLPTGFESLDLLLRRGGLMPGNFAILGGRTGTRKSTIMLNMAVDMARRDIPVALLGIDEPPWLYVVKLLSVWSGQSQEYIEEMWDEVEGHELREAWRTFARGRVHLLTGRRPGPDNLSSALDMASLGRERPAVLFIDYIGAMTREGKYGYAENSRIPLLVEELQLWSSESGVAVVALHQLSRNDEFGGTNNRNAGHIPVTKAQLRQAGEEQADIVLGSFRPALDPIGNMDMQTAKQVLGERFDEDDYYELRARVKKYQTSTFLQLLKNRPGTHEEQSGIELESPNDSLIMVEKEGTSGDTDAQ